MSDKDMKDDIYYDNSSNDIEEFNNEQDGIEEPEPLDAERMEPEDTTPVEEMPLEKRIQLAKNCTNPFGTIEPGIWIDAMDTINAWLSAVIVEVEENNIRVHFDGWPAKWDEWMKIGSYKVSPFRKHSVGYTGQTKIAMRKDEYGVEYYTEMMKNIDLCIQNDLKKLGAMGTTQFYRGTVFTALDTIMGRTYEESDEELLEISVPFIKKVLELICTYLKLIPTMLKSFEEDTYCDDLYLIDENIAIARCHQEFIEMIKVIF